MCGAPSRVKMFKLSDAVNQLLPQKVFPSQQKLLDQLCLTKFNMKKQKY